MQNVWFRYSVWQVRRGDLLFPSYEISRRSLILRNREELLKWGSYYFVIYLLRLLELCKLKHQLSCLELASEYQHAYEIFKKNTDSVFAVIKRCVYF